MKLFKILLTPPIVAISAMLLVLAGAAAPKIVYVAPGGTGDGTSWESAMGSVSNAYASAAAFAESGCDSGEVWLKAGRYELFNDEAGKILSGTGYIELRSKVTVRGGFAGGETDPSQADRDKNLTIISGDRYASASWNPNGAKPAAVIPMWTADADGRRTIFNPPNPEGTDDYWSSSYYGNPPGSYGFASKVGGLEACRFFGLTFTAFSDNCIATLRGDESTQPCTGLVVSNCNFYGCGSDRAGNVKYGAVYAYDTDLIVCDCRFIGCTQGIMDLPANVAAMGEIRDCTFERCCSLPVQFGDKTSPLRLNANCGIVIRDCQFSANYSTWGASAIRFETTANTGKSLVVVSNVVFKGNLSSGGATAAVSAAPIDYYGSAGWHQFYDCDFVGNKRLKSTAGMSVASCCAMYDAGKWLFKGCSFRDNTTELESEKTDRAAGGAVCSRGTNCYIYFHDCTFCGNSVSMTGPSSAGTVVVDNTNQRLSVCSSVFTGNTIVKVDAESGAETRGADIVVRGMTSNNNFTLVNTILYDEDSDYIALELNPVANGQYYFYKNYIKGFDPADWPDVKFDKFSEITTSGKVWLREPKKGPGAAYAIGLVTGPKSLRHGADTWFAGFDPERKTDDKMYWIIVAIRDEALSKTKPWRTLQSAYGFTHTWSDADASKFGVSKDDPPMTDAFGNPRTVGKMAYGPLNAPDLGLMLLLR